MNTNTNTNIDQVVAKAKAHVYKDPNSQTTSISMFGVCQSDGAPENKIFGEYTPSFNLSMGIINGIPAADFFESGQAYYVTFTKAPE